jgi:DNA-binding transcriptional LysR family regulator
MHRPPHQPRWDDLRIVLAVLRSGSFSGAAAALGIEQSTVSRRVAQLESELGSLLFERHQTGLCPTQLAERLREPAERMEGEVLSIVDAASHAADVIEGRVRIALTESLAVHVVIPHLLKRLRASHPRLQVDLITSTLAADLGRREADLAIRFFRPSQGDLVAKRIGLLPTAVLAHRAYAATRAGVPAQELDWIVLELPEGTGPDASFLAEHLPVTPALLTNNHLAQVEAVRAGLGVALLARAHLTLDPELVALELGLPTGPIVEMWLVAPRSSKALPRVQAVWEFLEAELAGLSDGKTGAL